MDGRTDYQRRTKFRAVDSTGCANPTPFALRPGWSAGQFLGFCRTPSLDQLTTVVIQIILNHLNAPVAGGNAFLGVEQPVMGQRLSYFHDLDMSLFSFPELPFLEQRQSSWFL